MPEKYITQIASFVLMLKKVYKYRKHSVKYKKKVNIIFYLCSFHQVQRQRWFQKKMWQKKALYRIMFFIENIVHPLNHILCTITHKPIELFESRKDII